MLCSEAHGHLSAGTGGTGLEAHLAACPACATLADSPPLRDALRDRAGASEVELQAMWEGTQSALAREAHWSRSLSHLPTGQRVALLALSVAMLVGGVVVFAPRPDLAAGAAGDVPPMLGGAGLVVLLGLWLGYRPIHRTALPGWVQLGAGAAALAVAWLPLWWPSGVGQGGMQAVFATGLAHCVRAMGCFAWGGVVGLILLGVLVLANRGDRRVSRSPAGLFLAAGLVGTVAVQVHCPVSDPAHVALGHSSVLTLLLAVPLFAYLRRG